MPPSCSSVSLVVGVALLVSRGRTAGPVAVAAAVGALGAVVAGPGGWPRVESGSFLPLGASMVGFACRFPRHSAARRGKYRVLATQLVVALGAVSAAAGLLATTSRWYPLAMPAQNLWRLSTTLTYSNAAGALLAVALLVGPRARATGPHHQAHGVSVRGGAGRHPEPGSGARGPRGPRARSLVAQLRRAAVRPSASGSWAAWPWWPPRAAGPAQPLAMVAVVVAVVLAVALPRRAGPAGVVDHDVAGDRSVVVCAQAGCRCSWCWRRWPRSRSPSVPALSCGFPIERRVALGSSEDRGHEWTAALRPVAVVTARRRRARPDPVFPRRRRQLRPLLA